MARSLRLYLAGRIVKGGGWREKVLGHRPMSVSDGEILDGPWGDFPIPGSIHFVTGPWFISCDHGCAHRENAHGILGGGCLTDVVPGHLGNRWTIVERCLDAIDRCDVFFAWLEPGAYGTVAELGYAKAKGKEIVVAMDVEHEMEISDLWFARHMADRIIDSKSADDALVEVILDIPTAERGECESPIELAFFDAILRCEHGGFTMYTQYEVGRYRLDFAFVHDDGRLVAVEVDGHDFHERTKQQAQRDRSRDRFLTASGWKVLRFTGSEIYRDAKKCAAEVSAMLTGSP